MPSHASRASTRCSGVAALAITVLFAPLTRADAVAAPDKTLTGIVHAPTHAGAAHKGAIASAYPLASQAGQEILAAGGNAFDAAVAVSAALAVVEPSSSGLGGGGFYLLHRQSDGMETMVDAREKAPGAANRDMYLDKAGNEIDNASTSGPLSSAIPGELEPAFEYLARKYGKLPLKQSLAPAIRLARNGFPLYARACSLESVTSKRFWRNHLMRRELSSRRTALCRKLASSSSNPNWPLRSKPLRPKARRASTRSGLRKDLVAGVHAGGGIWTLEDLKSYRVVERKPADR